MSRISRALATTVTLAAAAALSGCADTIVNAEATIAQLPDGTGVLKGMEFGLAQGSTEEVAYDVAAQTGGAQDALDASAVVPFVDADQVASVEVTPISVEQGSIEDYEWDADSARSVEGASVYYLRHRMSYVNGPVLANVGSSWFELAAGDEVVTDDLSLTAGAGPCGTEYRVESFGKGAYLESCTPLFVSAGAPAPDTIMWRAPVADGALVVQATWPMP